MRICSCCTSIVWNWTINRSSYIKDYKRKIFILSILYKLHNRDIYMGTSCMVEDAGKNENSDKSKSLTKINTDALFNRVLNDQYFNHIYKLFLKVINHVPNIVKPEDMIVKAGGMIVYKNKILIVQSNFNKWGFPKGHRNSGEDVLECAIREIKEETSLVVDLTENDRLHYIYDSTVIYYKQLTHKPKINIKQIIQEQKDCTGITWIKLSCLKKQCRGITEDGKYSVPFTSLLRKFVVHYF